MSLIAATITGAVHRNAGGDWTAVVVIGLVVAATITYLYDYILVSHPPQRLVIDRLANNIDRWLIELDINPRQNKKLDESLLLHYDYKYWEDTQELKLLSNGALILSTTLYLPDYVAWLQELDDDKRSLVLDELALDVWRQQLEFGVNFSKDSPWNVQFIKRFDNPKDFREQDLKDTMVSLRSAQGLILRIAGLQQKRLTEHGDR